MCMCVCGTHKDIYFLNLDNPIIMYSTIPIRVYKEATWIQWLRLGFWSLRQTLHLAIMKPLLFRTLGVLLVFHMCMQTSCQNIKSILNCSGLPADIVFVLDSSSSIWGPHFQQQLRFVTYMVNKLDIGMGPEQVRIGVEIFSDSARVEITLDESFDKEILKRKIGRIIRLKGNTNTADALNQLRENLFTPERGSRHGVKHLALVITDGNSTYPAATQVAAKACRDANIQLFAIGIGDSINLSELREIASEPKERFLYYAANYKTLDLIRDEVARQTCDAVFIHKSPTTTAPRIMATTFDVISRDQTDRVCRNKMADIFFLLDSSSSIPINEFRKEVHILEDIVNRFDIDCTKTRVAVAVYTHRYIPVLSFNSGGDKVEALKKIRNIKSARGGTDIGKAIHQVRRQVFNHNLRRPRAERILIVFTDGLSINYEQTSAETKLLQDSGVKIFIVGVGPGVDQNKLRGIASKPSNVFLNTFNTFDILFARSRILAHKACAINSKIFHEDRNVCNAAQPTDVVFIVNNNRFGQEKTSQILKASAEVIKIARSNGVFRYGTIFDDCLPKKEIAIGSITDQLRLIREMTYFRYSSLSSLLEKLQQNIFSRTYRNTRQVGLLFLDNTIDLNDPRIFAQARRAHSENIQLYVVVIGKGVDISRVQNVLVPKERIICVYSYETLQSHLPFLFTRRLCIPRQTYVFRKQALA